MSDFTTHDSTTPGKAILIVEDQALVALDLRLRLQRSGYRVPAMASSATQAIDAARTHLPDLILMDIELNGSPNGIEAAKVIRASVDVPVIFLTGRTDEETLRAAHAASPFGYITKPYTDIDFRTHIETACLKHHQESDLLISRGWLAATVMCAGEGIITTDLTGDVMLMNPAAELITGCRAGETISRKLRDCVCLADPDSESAANGPVEAIQSAAEGTVLKTRYQLFRKDGSGPSLIEATTSISRMDDVVLGVVMVIREITANYSVQ